MDKITLLSNYQRMVMAISHMLTVQGEYFKLRKMGMQAESNLAKCRTQEHYTRTLFKELHLHRPQIIESDIQSLVKDYNHFLDRCKVLLTAQFNWFQNVSDRQLMSKCKALEKEMRERIKRYNTLVKQPTLL